MATGLPVVSTAVCGIPELVTRRAGRVAGRPRRPGRAGGGTPPAGHRPRSAGLAARRRHAGPCADRFDGDAMAGRLVAPDGGGLPRERRARPAPGAARRRRDRCCAWSTTAPRPGRRRRRGARRFTHAGVALRARPRPDWLRGGHADDVEWRIEWVKLYEGLDLAHAYVLTGRPEYLRTWQDLVESFCDQVPVGHDTSDVIARRLQNWLYAWQAFAAARPSRAASRAGRPAGRTDPADADHLADHLTPERNHRTLELYTLLLVALRSAGRDRAAHVAGRAGRQRRRRHLARRRPPRVQHRLPLHRPALAARRDRERPPQRSRRARRRCWPRPIGPATSRCTCSARTAARRPCPTATQGDFRPLLALAAELLGRPELLWAATGRSSRHAAAGARAVSFPFGGYHVQRSGWGDPSSAVRGRSAGGPRLRTDRRRRPRPLRPALGGAHGAGTRWSSTRDATPTRTTRRLAAPLQRHRRAQHRHRRRPRPDALPAGQAEGPDRAHRLVCRVTSARPRRDRRRGPQPVVRRGPCPHPGAVDDDFWMVHDRLRAPTAHRTPPAGTSPAGAQAATGHSAAAAPSSVRARVGLIIPAGRGPSRLEPAGYRRLRRAPPAPVVVAEDVAGRRRPPHGGGPGPRGHARGRRPRRVGSPGRGHRVYGSPAGGRARTCWSKPARTAAGRSATGRGRGASGFAPDPALAARDALLDPGWAEPPWRTAWGRRPAGRLRRRCWSESKYRIGESLRVVYRLGCGRARMTVTARIFPGGPARPRGSARRRRRLTACSPGGATGAWRARGGRSRTTAGSAARRAGRGTPARPAGAGTWRPARRVESTRPPQRPSCESPTPTASAGTSRRTRRGRSTVRAWPAYRRVGAAPEPGTGSRSRGSAGRRPRGTCWCSRR